MRLSNKTKFYIRLNSRDTTSRMTEKIKSVTGMKIIDSWDFKDGITIAHVEAFPEDDYDKLVRDTLRNFHPFLNWKDFLTDEQNSKMEALSQTRAQDFKLRLAAIRDGVMIGASFSFQETPKTLQTGMSTVRPEFRGLGLYTAMTQKVLEISKSVGYQSVHSFHLLTNNAVLIAKLKLGFKIVGLETDAVNGTLLKMAFHHNEMMEKSLRFRSGELFLFNDDELYEFYGVSN